MRFLRRRILLPMLTAVTAIGLSAGVALAQDANSHYDGDGEPTNVPKLEMQRPLKAWGLSILFLFGALALGFKSSKRTSADR